MTREDALVHALSTGWIEAKLAPVDAALCEFAERLTREPGTFTSDHLASLRRHGLDDRAILDACQVVAYFNFVNRMALGLGVELEPGWRWEGDSPVPARDR